MTSRLATALAAAALVATTAAVVAPAEAAAPTTVSIKVTGPDGSPAEGIGLELVQSSRYAFFEDVTDERGVITAAVPEPDFSDPLRSGRWKLLLTDTNEERDGDYYAFDPVVVSIKAGQDNQVGPRQMSTGAVVEGRVLAPSGKPWTDLEIGGDVDGDVFAGDYTDLDLGTYRLSGLTTGTVTFVLGEEGEDTDYETDVVAGSVKQFDLTGYRATCRTSFSVTSAKAGQATFKVLTTGMSNGITKPGGKITVKNGATTVKTIDVTGATQSVTATGQAKGKKITYKATYAGGDCADWSATKSVTIKK